MDETALRSQRSDVIEKFINIETIMGAIISQHYFGQVRRGFLLDVLYDEQCSFALRRNILFKVVPDFDHKKKEELGRLNRIRNYFAHCNLTLIEGSDTQGLSRVPNPRDATKSLDFDALFKEFNLLEGPITEYLATVFKNRGGELS